MVRTSISDVKGRAGKMAETELNEQDDNIWRSLNTIKTSDVTPKRIDAEN